MQKSKKGISEVLIKKLNIDYETLRIYMNENGYGTKEKIRLFEIFRYMILNNVSDIEEVKKEYPNITSEEFENATNEGIMFLVCMQACNPTPISRYPKQ